MSTKFLSGHTKTGWTLARAHARSGDAEAITGYIGSGDKFDKAIASFAQAFADQNERDHKEFVRAIRSGRIEASDAAPASLAL